MREESQLFQWVESLANEGKWQSEGRFALDKDKAWKKLSSGRGPDHFSWSCHDSLSVAVAYAPAPRSPPCWYRPRKSFKSPLWRMVIDHFDTFVSGYDSRYRETHGKLRDEAQNAFLNFQRCGDPNFGITLFRCDTCDVNLGVPFTCKARICPSCLARKAETRAVHLSSVLPEVGHRHLVFGLPKKMGLRQRMTFGNALLSRRPEVAAQNLEGIRSLGKTDPGGSRRCCLLEVGEMWF